MTPRTQAEYILNVITKQEWTDAAKLLLIERELDRATVDEYRWIPVTELLPTHGNNVSILFHNGNRYSACYVAGAWYWNDGQWLDGTLIAAWCEMPFAPKAKT